MVTIESPIEKAQLNANSVKQESIMKRTANANWQGNLKEGTGTLSTASGILDQTNYSFKTRFEDEWKGTNPEELLAAAHAGCFTMSVASILSKKGLNPTSLDTKATVTLEGLNITSVHLKITGAIDGIDADGFTAVTKEAESNCLISKILNIPITSEAHFIV